MKLRGVKIRFVFSFLCVFTFVFTPADFVAAATLSSIAVTPSNLKISAGQIQPFVATGTFSDGSSRVLSPAAISAGYDHTCALLTDGTVQCWGNNQFGQLGNGTNTGPQICSGYYACSTTPVPVSGISTVTAISSGDGHTCALLTDGTVQCWGTNFEGELGNGSRVDSDIPVPVTGISTATAISSGGFHTCALTAGTVQCWGDNSLTPVTIPGISAATAIAAGYYHTCALISGGTVQCWGGNLYGELGNGTLTDSSSPVPVSGINTATAISAGLYSTCALISDGTVQCWGIISGSSTPVTVPGISAATAISAGRFFTCALLSEGTIQCWGNNFEGELGNGSTTDSSTPVIVSGINKATAISAGGSQTCALIPDGTAQCWGDNLAGQLGNGTSTGPQTCFGYACSTVPVPVYGIGAPTAISAGAFFTCALLSNGTVQCWGLNDSGQLGNGTFTDSSTPVPVLGISTATAISAGGGVACALISDGTVQCWGNNGYGQLGNGNFGSGSTTPVMVSGISTAIAISIGGDHTCALLSDGTVQCWGDNTYGQLGNGRPALFSTIPVQVSGISTAIAIDAGYRHTCALISNGTVQCWGLNDAGQLGNGSPDFVSFTPVRVSGINTATAISAGYQQTCALLSDGTVQCWGDNGNGVGFSIAIAVSAGVYHTCALISDGTVQCGDIFTTPAPVSGISTAIAISAGNYHTCALLSDGTVQCWDNPTTPAPVSGMVPALTVVWRSGRQGVATINANGVAAGQSPGITTITALSGEIKGKAMLVVHPNKPDLLITAVSTTTTAIAPGKTLLLLNTVMNQGGKTAGAFLIAFRLSTDAVYRDGDDIVFTTNRLVGSLNAGASNAGSAKLTIPSKTPPGYYYICAMADGGHNVPESNESNNGRCTATTIAVFP